MQLLHRGVRRRKHPRRAPRVLYSKHVPAQPHRFEWLIAALRLADRIIPRQAWPAGYQVYLWDMRIRARLGKRIV